MDVDLDPSQPDEVVRTIAALLDEETRPVDPWWRAGIDENLDSNT